jgi:hypothetical protein
MNAKLLLITIAVSLVHGCDLFGEEVEYDLSCETVSCPNADDTSNYSGVYTNFYSCTWHCASYEGNDSAYVSLSFSSDGGCWRLVSEYIASGICE